VQKLMLVRRVGSVCQNLDGRVRSLNPARNEPVNGTYGPYHWEDRPAGAQGGYEQNAVNGSTIVYNPTGKEVVVFAFFQDVPHSDGLSAMSEEPIKIETVPL